jgi:hypothetical protein
METMPNRVKSKKRGRVQNQKRESAASVIHCNTGALTHLADPKKAVNSTEGGNLLMAMLQSGRARTESSETEKVSHSATSYAIYSNDAHSSTLVRRVESFPKLKPERIVSSTAKQCLYGTCQQQNEDSSEHLKALLKVCT